MNPFVIEHSDNELRLTAEFQSHIVALAAVTLKSFSAHRADKEPQAKKGLELELDHRVRNSGVNGGNVCFEISMTMDALADGNADKPLFHIECVFELLCQLDQRFSPSSEHLTAFERGNA